MENMAIAGWVGLAVVAFGFDFSSKLAPEF